MKNLLFQPTRILLSLGLLTIAINTMANDNTPDVNLTEDTYNGVASQDCGTINGGEFCYYSDQATGTGIFDPFVRIQQHGSNDSQSGYNTTQNNNNDYAYDEVHSIHTHDVLIQDVDILNGKYQFELDLNESNGNNANLLSLDGIRIFASDTGGLNSLLDSPDFTSHTLELWNMDANADAWVLLDSKRVNRGSGASDMILSLDSSLFDNLDQKYTNFIFWSEFGLHEDYLAGTSSSATFEEWRHSSVPEPSTLLLLSLALLGLLPLRRAKLI